MPQFELVETTTKDKLVHQGLFYTPPKPGKRALLWVHGLTSRFYSDVAFMQKFASACERKGFGFAAFNTRGHDFVTSAHRLDKTQPAGYTHATIGAGVEVFTECVHDIDAGVEFLIRRGFSEVVLVGHSTGANKVCYYAGTVHNKGVIGIVLTGPMSDRYSVKTNSITHRKHARFMQEKIRKGRGDELLSGFDFFPLTPKRWVSLLKKGSREDVFNYRDGKNALVQFSKITQPLLVLFAQNDEYADRPIKEIQIAFDQKATSKHYQSALVAGASHNFTGKEQELVGHIVSWAASI